MEARFGGPALGTTWSVKSIGPVLGNAERKRIEGLIVGALDAVDRQMSTYRPESELMRFNGHRALSPFEASAPLRTVVMKAREVSEASDGAFDATIRPLVDAWGFGPKGQGSPPDAATIEALNATVGWTKVQITGTALTKTHPDVSIDLSAIAKGFAADEIARTLKTAGHTRFMVEVGGEIVATGLNGAERPWRIGVESPSMEKQGLHESMPLMNRAMATSGDYRNFYEVDGKRISHTIDPRTGLPIDHGLASVSVIAADCMSADAWATAFSVLGPEAGLKLAESRQMAALFIVREPSGGFEEQTTAAWRTLRQPKAPEAP